MKQKYIDVLIRSVVMLIFGGIVYALTRNLSLTLIVSIAFYALVLDLFGFKILKKIRQEKQRVKIQTRIVSAFSAIPQTAGMMQYLFKTPRFILYFDAPVGTTYQIDMWLPYLKLLNMPFLIVGRQLDTVKELRARGLDVIHLKGIADVDEVLAGSSVKAIFYVNNGMRNMHTVRYNSIIHIQMLHGESDKVTSFNPVCAMYDFLFVSGQLAIDRYFDNGVFIEPHKFRIVSRPQVGNIESNYAPGNPVRTIFYAPTWSGTYQDQNICSIRQAYAIVDTLIQRGYRVIFRPHPLSYKSEEERAIITSVAEMMIEKNTTKEEGDLRHCVSNDSRFDLAFPTTTDCIDASDFMISDVTSVVGDWLFSMKPLAVIDSTMNREQFQLTNPLTLGAYYLDISLSQLDDILSDINSVDSMFPVRLEQRQYALGVAVGESPVDKFVDTATDILENFDKISFQKSLIGKARGA